MNDLARWLFAAPWWLLAVAGAAAVAFALFALSRRDGRLVKAAVGLIVLVALWAVLGLAIATPAERAESRTRAMIEAYEGSDWDTLATLVDDETRFSTLLKGQDIVRAARLTHEELEHGSIEINSVEVQQDPGGIQVFVRIISEQRSEFVPRLPTSWRFDYVKRGDEWKLERIEPLATDHVDPNTILRNVRIPPEVTQRP